MKRAISLLTTIALLASGTVVAQNRICDDDITIVVQYSDLNLASVQGQAQLDRRLEAALRQACPQPDNRDLKAKLQQRQCLAKAREMAKTQVAQIKSTTSFASGAGQPVLLAP
jgi:UrcA family protein